MTTAQIVNQSSSSTASPEQISQKFDLAISLLLHLWPALSVAVNEAWGGPDSAEKRDWFAGAISDLFAQRSDADEEDVEDMLMQIMGDEFECQLEDESEVGVAAEICRMRRLTERGQFEEVDRLYETWLERRKRGPEKVNLQVVNNGAQGDEDDDDEDSEVDDEDGGVDVDAEGDVDMEGAPALVSVRKEKPVPEIDDDGFTKVVGKKRT